ncbi:carbohydrate binding family 9 domain-containing protein [Myxococcota bacterium]|nr:carbohydrate binding family 9 domain-containing protein [Myxococcota bacterium]
MLTTWSLSFAFAAAPTAPEVVAAQAVAPPTIDGVLDEAIWAEAQEITSFTRYVPAPGGAPAERISVRVAQDEETLYVGVLVEDTAQPIRARLSPREDLNDDDQIGVYLDTFNDERSGFVFYFNALGVQQDARWANGEWVGDWNTVLSAEATRHERGFTLEIAIPFRSLRYPDTGLDPQTWGLIVTRKVPSEGAKYSFPTLQRGHPQLFSQAARLTGLTPPPQRAQVELMPVLAARQHAVRAEDGSLAWSGLDPWHQSIWPALDARLALSAETRLAATIHPDFSQVEGDPSQLDLNQRFAFYFSERRPFFLEGVEAFTDPLDTLYTRRINAPAYGVKLAGRGGPVTFGALNAVDLAPIPSIHEEGTPGFSEAALDGQVTLNSFARGRVDVLDGGGLGFSVAEKHVLTPDGAANAVGAMDLTLPFRESWFVSGAASGSTLFAEKAQLSGASWATTLRRTPAVGPGFSVSLSDVTPGFRNELGYLTQSGISRGSAWGEYTFAPERGPDRLAPGFWISGREERDGDGQREAGLSGYLVEGPTYLGFWASRGETTQTGAQAPNGELGAELSLTPSSWLTVEANGRIGEDIQYSTLLSARYQEVTLSATVRPVTWLRVDVLTQREWFTPIGEPTQTGLTSWTRVNAQLTRALGMRVIADYSTSTEVLTTSQLFSWVLHPGTEAYLGATERSAPREDGLIELTVFAKVSVLWRG